MVDVAGIAAVLARVETHGSRVAAGIARAADIQSPRFFAQLRAAPKRMQQLDPIRDDARRAAELLGTLPQDGPVLRLRETMLAAANPQFGTGNRSSVLRVEHSLRKQTEAIGLWAEHLDLDRPARIAELERLRTVGVDAMQPADWRRLSAILDADDALELAPELPRQLRGGGVMFTDFARDVAKGGILYRERGSQWFLGRRFFDAWNAARIAPAERAATVERILLANPQSVSREDWRLLSSVLEVDPGVLRAGQAPDDIALMAMRVGRGADQPLDDLTRAHWLQRIGRDDELRASTRAELLDPTSDTVSEGARALLELERLDAVGIAGREAMMARIRHQIPTSPTSAGPWLDDVASWMRGRAVPEQLEQVRASALDLVKLNKARVAGRVKDGYGRHPDYAELGRIRSIARLLDAVTAAPVSATPAARPMAAVAATDEVLRW